MNIEVIKYFIFKIYITIQALLCAVLGLFSGCIFCVECSALVSCLLSSDSPACKLTGWDNSVLFLMELLAGLDFIGALTEKIKLGTSPSI